MVRCAQSNSGGMLAQVSEAARLRDPRSLRIYLIAALALWVAGAIVFATLPEDSAARAFTAVAVYWTAVTLTVLALIRTLWRPESSERAFWLLLGGGIMIRFAGDFMWTISQTFGSAAKTAGLAPQDIAYAISYALLLGAMVRLVAMTTHRITLVITLDALSIMLSVGVLAWYFVLSPSAAAAGLVGWHGILVVLFQPVCDAALLFLGLVVVSASHRPRFVAFLVGGFLAFLTADVVYLGLRSGGPYNLGNWPDLLWALGSILLGLAALASTGTVPNRASWSRINSWRIFSFWLSPLSPPLHFAVMFLWGAFNPPLPIYVSLGGAILLSYMALRIGLVAFLNRRLGHEQEASGRQSEQSRLLYEMHDTVKQNVHGVSLTLRAALEADRRGERDAAREMFRRALEVSREAEFQISRPYDELQSLREETTPSLGDFLRHRLRKFEEYFGIKTHDDLKEPLENLNSAEAAAVTRIVVESFWNVAKHSGARNLYLESRRVGSLLLIRIRDDGRGFDTADPPRGLGLKYMRQRTREVGAELDVISTPGHGATVQLRFHR